MKSRHKLPWNDRPLTLTLSQTKGDGDAWSVYLNTFNAFARSFTELSANFMHNKSHWAFEAKKSVGGFTERYLWSFLYGLYAVRDARVKDPENWKFLKHSFESHKENMCYLPVSHRI